MSSEPPLVIIGAGPTGLGAAWRLQERKNDTPWMLIDTARSPGGLAASVLDDQGFTWDLGGHVLFSHYRYFDEVLDSLLKESWVKHQRESWIWMRHRFIPYPMQNHLRYLPIAERWRCLWGLWRASQDKQNAPILNFKDWLRRKFGTSLYATFLGPYNTKVWAYDPSQLTADWMQERVATIDLGRTLKNMLLGKDERDWGPNATFRYPLRGGTGAIWQTLYQRLPEEKVHMGRSISKIRTKEKAIDFVDGKTVYYDKILSTMPLDQLLPLLQDRQDLWPDAQQFRHSSTHVIGIGLRGQPPPSLRTKCWMYFPESDVPFYRVTVFSNYSPFNVPAESGPYWSLLAEVSESSAKPVDASNVVSDTIMGLRKSILGGVLPEVVSTFHRRLEYGYPTPFLGRSTLLSHLDEELRRAQIWSRGRFGGWKYEISNQDHSFMQGVEAVDHWVDGSEEKTYCGTLRS